GRARRRPGAGVRPGPGGGDRPRGGRDRQGDGPAVEGGEPEPDGERPGGGEGGGGQDAEALRPAGGPGAQAGPGRAGARRCRGGRGAEEWVISPGARLWLVPWSALPAGDRYVVESHSVRLVQSGRQLALPPRAAGAVGKAVVMTEIDYGPARRGAAMAFSSLSG